MSTWLSKYRFRQRKATVSRDRKRPFPWTALLLGLLLWLLAQLILYVGRDISHTQFVEGQRAPSMVVALVDFEAVDTGATELSRRQAMDAVLPVFTVHREPLRNTTRTIATIIETAEKLRDADDPDDVWPDDFPEVSGIILQPEDILALAPENREQAAGSIMTEALETVWSGGIISPLERESRFHGVADAGAITIRETDETLRSPVLLGDLPTPSAAVRAMMRHIREEFHAQDIPVPTRTLPPLLSAWIAPNLRYDDATTESLRAEARQTVAPVMKRVRAGTTLIQAGERITTAHLEKLRSHERQLSALQTDVERRLALIGRGALLLFATAICGGLLLIMNPNLLYERSKVLLLVMLCLLSLALAKFLVYLSGTVHVIPSSLVEFMLPIALTPLLAVILLGISAAIVTGIWASFAAAVLFDNNFAVFAMGLLVTVLVAHTARDVRKRSQVLRTGVWVGLAQMLYAVSLAFLFQNPFTMAAMQAGTAMGMGISVALATLLLLPLLEAGFKITTNITLLELSDMTHPLLQRLAIEAPGTYHHSLMVANLGQSAATEIGVNALLVRVCAYYHDVGKLTKPEFFAENMGFRENPHDDLSPSMSTLVIISHVKEGVSMARRNNLPQPIIDGIEQHHGTSLVYYFYHRARTETGDSDGESRGNGRAVNEGDFRYPGPKPKKKEMAILQLADSVEAASRAMEKSSPVRIETLVNEIVDDRLQDNQLDECDLTISELKAIKRSFIFTLTNMLHGRISYPKDENRDQQPTTGVSGSSGNHPPVRPVDHGPGTTAE